MTECYHMPCDSIRPPFKADFADFKFYQNTVQATLQTAIELSRAQCVPSEQLEKFYNEIEDDGNWKSAASSSRSANNGRNVQDPVVSLSQFIKFLKTL